MIAYLLDEHDLTLGRKSRFTSGPHPSAPRWDSAAPFTQKRRDEESRDPASTESGLAFSFRRPVSQQPGEDFTTTITNQHRLEWESVKDERWGNFGSVVFGRDPASLQFRPPFVSLDSALKAKPISQSHGARVPSQ